MDKPSALSSYPKSIPSPVRLTPHPPHFFRSLGYTSPRVPHAPPCPSSSRAPLLSGFQATHLPYSPRFCVSLTFSSPSEVLGYPSVSHPGPWTPQPCCRLPHPSQPLGSWVTPLSCFYIKDNHECLPLFGLTETWTSADLTFLKTNPSRGRNALTSICEQWCQRDAQALQNNRVSSPSTFLHKIPLANSLTQILHVPQQAMDKRFPSSLSPEILPWMWMPNNPLGFKFTLNSYQITALPSWKKKYSKIQTNKVSYLTQPSGPLFPGCVHCALGQPWVR